MNRRLAVPIAIRNLWNRNEDKESKARAVKGREEDADEIEIVHKLAENRARLDSLMEDIEGDFDGVEESDISNELDYIEASIKLGLLEITGELEESPYSDELFEEAALA